MQISLLSRSKLDASASKRKAARAEPAAALFERKRAKF
jgi:phage terminase large subunit-like protein